MRGEQSGCRPDAVGLIENSGEPRAYRFFALIPAQGDETGLHVPAQQVEGREQLRLSLPIEQRLVFPHPRTRAAGQHQTMERGKPFRSTGGRR